MIARAGFPRDEVEIGAERHNLSVTRRKQKDDVQRHHLHRVIAARDFEHRFQLADHVHVTGARLDNGLLNIDLVREIPEALKPRKIEIGNTSDNVQLLQRNAA